MHDKLQESAVMYLCLYTRHTYFTNLHVSVYLQYIFYSHAVIKSGNLQSALHSAPVRSVEATVTCTKQLSIYHLHKAVITCTRQLLPARSSFWIHVRCQLVFTISSPFSRSCFPPRPLPADFSVYANSHVMEFICLEKFCLRMESERLCFQSYKITG